MIFPRNNGRYKNGVTMIRSGLFLSVALIYDSISTVFAPGKDLTTNKSSLVDNSQPLTFLTMESPTTTVTLRPFSFLFLSYFYAYVDLFYVIISEIYLVVEAVFQAGNFMFKVQLWTYFTPCSSLSMANFAQVNAEYLKVRVM